MSREDVELIEDLDKWTLKNLTQKFMERLQHLKANHINKDEMMNRIKELSSKYEKK